MDGRVIGFTGTQIGMMPLQIESVGELLSKLYRLGFRTAHHGVCIGADSDFHALARAYEFRIIGHPGTDDWGKSPKRADLDCDETRNSKRYLDRNNDILTESEALVATPKEFEEQLRSGTWSTIRKCRDRFHKPCVIVWPDGTTQGDIT